MAVKNDKLGGTDWIDGDTLFAEDLNDTFDVVVERTTDDKSFILKNHARALINSSQLYSADTSDIYGEGYNVAAGRNGSVDTAVGETTSYFFTDAYIGAGFDAINDTLQNPDSFSNPNNAFDGHDSTYAQYVDDSGSGAAEVTFGITFDSEKYVGPIRIRALSQSRQTGSVSMTTAIYLQSYDGSTWSDEETLVTDTNTANLREIQYNSTTNLDSSVEGIRLRFQYYRNTGDARQEVYLLDYPGIKEVEIIHDIPAGTFPDTISSAILSPLVKAWETGAEIEYKLTNVGEDTGWLPINVISTFTAFTSQPTKCIIKLIPKGTSPTWGVPSIYGVGYYTK